MVNTRRLRHAALLAAASIHSASISTAGDGKLGVLNIPTTPAPRVVALLRTGKVVMVDAVTGALLRSHDFGAMANLTYGPSLAFSRLRGELLVPLVDSAQRK